MVAKGQLEHICGCRERWIDCEWPSVFGFDSSSQFGADIQAATNWLDRGCNRVNLNKNRSPRSLGK